MPAWRGYMTAAETPTGSRGWRATQTTQTPAQPAGGYTSPPHRSATPSARRAAGIASTGTCGAYPAPRAAASAQSPPWGSRAAESSRSASAPRGGVEHLMTRLAARLRHVRITCGDWTRVLTPTLLRPEVRRGGDPVTGILLDPPYAVSGDIYAQGDATVSTEVRDWCLAADPEQRIVLCGYDTEHDELLTHGWTVTEGRAGSGAGRSARSDNGRRERLWLSPACTPPAQDALFPTHTERTTP